MKWKKTLAPKRRNSDKWKMNNFFSISGLFYININVPNLT